mmetsp:Transcript_19943/g.34313  ORF Transcript_19943/g.34313 Transcript_19943/m.34313 type:complete len:287 (+) Transcript_19943:2-862(+)
MDQAISMTAHSGFAKRIDFNPFAVVDVPLPTGATIVVANTLVEANKYTSADTCYNRRVVECILAAKLLAKAMGFDWLSVKRLCDLQDSSRSSGVGLPSPLTLEQLSEKTDEVLRESPYSPQEAADLLGTDIPSLAENCFGGLNARVGMPEGPVLQLYRRAKHVFTESIRVRHFEEACRKDPYPDQLQDLGRLMNESHASCRDLFDCSCPELDELTAICRAAGAYGSRLTGAGWGGCTVSLVPDAVVAEFLVRVQDQYFTPMGRPNATPDSLFACKPSAGAAVYRPL